MKSRVSIICAISLLSVLTFTGCQTANTTATSAQLQRSYEVERGTVLFVKEVTIDDSDGEGGGAVIGAIAGGIEGGDQDGVEGAIVGAIAGGLIGGIIENIGSTRTAYELHIRKYDGHEIRVLQRKQSIEDIRPNDIVEILTNFEGGTIVQKV